MTRAEWDSLWYALYTWRLLQDYRHRLSDSEWTNLLEIHAKVLGEKPVTDLFQ